MCLLGSLTSWSGARSPRWPPRPSHWTPCSTPRRPRTPSRSLWSAPSLGEQRKPRQLGQFRQGVADKFGLSSSPPPYKKSTSRAAECGSFFANCFCNTIKHIRMSVALKHYNASIQCTQNKTPSNITACMHVSCIMISAHTGCPARIGLFKAAVAVGQEQVGRGEQCHRHV